MKTYTRTFTSDHLTSAFGEGAEVKLASLHGYPTLVGNPLYDKTIPAKIQDPAWVIQDDYTPEAYPNPPMIDNPAYEPETIQNPQSVEDFLNELNWSIGIDGMFKPYRNYIKEEYGNTALPAIDAKFAQLKKEVNLTVTE